VPSLLEGNGVALVRERTLASAVQGSLERLYQLDRVADVKEFLAPAEGGERERLIVREAEDGALEMMVRVPSLLRREMGLAEDAASLDALCQLIEGVSHFVYLADRSSANRETTQLELEVQAEVDKYVVLAAAVSRFDLSASEKLRVRLFEGVCFAHAEASLEGERYRVANEVAHRFVLRLERAFVAPGRWRELHGELRRFHRSGQEDKLRLARAA
jgi:hypothetical protein